jgi:HlyD family type I secretion membrane fusion protein
MGRSVIQLSSGSATHDLAALSPSREPNGPAVPSSIRGPALAGLLTIGLAFGGFGGWAALAPLNSAVVAQGTVMVSDSRKDVQHLEGGIVKELLVRDGDVVKAGDVLLRLDPARAVASLSMVRAQLDADLALEARLVAERDGIDVPRFPGELLARAGDPAVGGIIAGQRLQMETRRQAREVQVSILNQRMAQFQEQIGGLESQILHKRRQIELLGEELEGKRFLFGKGYSPKAQILALEREAARLNGEIGEHTGEIARARQAIGENELQTSQVFRGFQDEVAEALRKVQMEIADLRERLTANEDMVRRLDIRAPVAGTVVGLSAHTEGGVIAPGAVVMQIVPLHDDLVVEAHVMPNDISHVYAGQEAGVRFPTFASRTTPAIYGVVKQVSADSLVDQHSGLPYYLARITVSESELEKLKDKKIMPGMAADLMMTIAERSALQYMVSPLLDIIEKSMREH